MSNSLLAMQTALAQAFQASVAMRTLIGNPVRFYDQRLEQVIFPYILVMSHQETPLIVGEGLSEAVMSLMVHSSQEASDEVKAIITQARLIIEGTESWPEVETMRLTSFRLSFVDVFKSADRRKSFGLMRVRCVLEPV